MSRSRARSLPEFNQAPVRDRTRSMTREPERDPFMPDLSMAREYQDPDPEPQSGVIQIDSEEDEIIPPRSRRGDRRAGPPGFPIPEVPPADITRGVNWVGPSVVGLIFFYLASYAT